MEFVDFAKKRDVSKTLSDTSRFISQEWKPLLTIVLKFCLVPIILVGLSGTYNNVYELNRNSTDYISSSEMVAFFDDMGDIPYWIDLAMESIAHAFILITILAYIKSYTANNGSIDALEVTKTFKQKTAPYVVLFGLTSVITFVGYFLFLFPGIYFGTVFSLVGCLLVFENKGFLGSVEYSFDFIRGHWWYAFGVFFVINIVVRIAVAGESIFSDYYGTEGVLDAKNFGLMTMFNDPIYFVLNFLYQIAEMLLNILSIVAMTLVYFSIRNQKPLSKTEAEIR
jgi:nitrate reductase NapE component